MEEKHLIPMDISPVKLFTEKGLDPILFEIKKKVDEFEPELETAGGRKEIASFAHKIAQSKVFIDKAGKELVAKQKAELKLIDNERKRSRDFLDEQRDRARQPLTDWEEADKAREEAERLEQEFNADFDAALEFHALWLKEKELEALKEKILMEAEKKAEEEEAARIKQEEIEREDRLKKEAAEQAKKKAEEAAERKIKEAREAVEKAERDKIAAREKAEREKQEAIDRTKREAEERAIKIEAHRIAKENEERAMIEADLLAAKKKAAHHKHRKKIEGEAMKSFVMALGCQPSEAVEMVKIIKNNEIKNVTINY